MKSFLTVSLIAATMLSSAAYAASPAKAQAASPAATQTSSSWASDNGFFFKPYVGADYDYVSINYSTIPGTSSDYGTLASKSLNGGDFHVGARVHKYLGFEASYLATASSSKNNILGSGLNSSIKLSGFTFDALGYLPIQAIPKLELIGTAGVSNLKATIDFNGVAAGSGHKTETKGRVGAGAQYWLTDNLNVRGLVRYQGANFSGVVDDAIVSSIGLNWQF
jgi:opacity protein-like surface antigen